MSKLLLSNIPYESMKYRYNLCSYFEINWSYSETLLYLAKIVRSGNFVVEKVLLINCLKRLFECLKVNHDQGGARHILPTNQGSDPGG